MNDRVLLLMHKKLLHKYITCFSLYFVNYGCVRSFNSMNMYDFLYVMRFTQFFFLKKVFEKSVVLFRVGPLENLQEAAQKEMRLSFSNEHFI